MKTYTIIGGVNGTGKSSLTGVLKTQKTDLGRIIDVDKITAQNGGSAIQGGKIALERIRECLDKGLSFTQETTLFRPQDGARGAGGAGARLLQTPGPGRGAVRLSAIRRHTDNPQANRPAGCPHLLTISFFFVFYML